MICINIDVIYFHLLQQTVSGEILLKLRITQIISYIEKPKVYTNLVKIFLKNLYNPQVTKVHDISIKDISSLLVGTSEHIRLLTFCIMIFLISPSYY